jgi:hypothetical protein
MLAYSVDHFVEGIMAGTGAMRQEGRFSHKKHKSKPPESTNLSWIIPKGLVLSGGFDLCFLCTNGPDS